MNWLESLMDNIMMWILMPFCCIAALVLAVFLVISLFVGDSNSVTIYVTDAGCYRHEMVGKTSRQIAVICPRDIR